MDGPASNDNVEVGCSEEGAGGGVAGRDDGSSGDIGAGGDGGADEPGDERNSGGKSRFLLIDGMNPKARRPPAAGVKIRSSLFFA